MQPIALIFGGVIICIGALFLYYGAKMPKGKLVSWGFGEYSDRYGIMMRGFMILFCGALALAVGIML